MEKREVSLTAKAESQNTAIYQMLQDTTSIYYKVSLTFASFQWTEIISLKGYYFKCSISLSNSMVIFLLYLCIE